MPTLDEHRSRFPALQGKHYFNYGIQGPLSRPALEAAVVRWTEQQTRGPASAELIGALFAQEEDLRARFARLVGAEPDTIALVDSTCTGCSIVLQGVPWREGDHVVLTDAEYPAITWGVTRLRERFGVEHTVASVQGRAEGAAEAIARALRPTTRLVVVSHVLWTTGELLDVQAIARACRASASSPPPRLLVDGAQSAGVVPLALAASGVDYYAFPGHKHLGGPDGVGALYLRREAAAALEPTFSGWRGIFAGPDGEPVVRPGARRFEQGTTFFAGRAAMMKALDIHDDFAPIDARIARTIHAAARLHEGLRRVPGVSMVLERPAPTSLVPFRLEGWSPDAVVEQLAARRFLVRSLTANQCVRPSVGYLTTDAEIDALIDAVAQLKPA